MVSVSELLSSPKYAAIIGGIIGLVAKMIDNRMSDTKGTLVGYLKSIAYGAALLALWTYLTSKTTSGATRIDRDYSGGGSSPTDYAPRRMTQPFADRGYQ